MKKELKQTVVESVEDAAKAEYLKRFPYPTSDDSKQELECLSKQSGFKQGAVFGAEWQKQQSGNDAIEFAEWCNSHGWLYSKSLKCWLKTLRFGMNVSDKEFTEKYTKTSKQLYDLWQQSKKK